MNSDSQYENLIHRKTGKSTVAWFELLEQSGQYFDDISAVIHYLRENHQLAENAAMLVAAAYKTTMIDSSNQ